MSAPLTIRKVLPDELEALLNLSKQTFFDAFHHLNNPDDMEAYAAKYFTRAQFALELNNPQSEFYFALLDDEIAGYIKLNYADAQTELQDHQSLEVERIYVSAVHQGKQIGRHLLYFAIQLATSKNFKSVWLGVWEHNDRAIKFYQQHGFTLFGSHDFMLGNDLQKDVLMRKMLPTF